MQTAQQALDMIIKDTGEYLGTLVEEERAADKREQFQLALQLKSQGEAVVKVREIIQDAIRKAKA